MSKCPLCGHVSDKPLRSANQNNYYFGVCVALLSDYTGFSKDEMHEVLKHKFLSFEKQSKKGHTFTITRSTTTLNTVEMEQYLASIRQWAVQELDLQIPEPNEEVIHASTA